MLSVEFEWDPEKSTLNQTKHGINFETAAKLWSDESLIVLSSRYPEEERYLAIGRINKTLWTAIITERSARVRLISVRRARKDERRIYDENQSQEP